MADAIGAAQAAQRLRAWATVVALYDAHHDRWPLALDGLDAAVTAAVGVTEGRAVALRDAAAELLRVYRMPRAHVADADWYAGMNLRLAARARLLEIVSDLWLVSAGALDDVAARSVA